jgi:hypothetical protein
VLYLISLQILLFHPFDQAAIEPHNAMGNQPIRRQVQSKKKKEIHRRCRTQGLAHTVIKERKRQTLRSIESRGGNVTLPKSKPTDQFFYISCQNRRYAPPTTIEHPFNVSGKVDANQVEQKKKRIKFNAGTRKNGQGNLVQRFKSNTRRNGWRW